MGSITGPSGGSSAVPPEAGAMPAGCESCGLQDASQALHGGLTQRDPMPPMGSYTGSDDSGGTSTCRQAAAAAAAADATPPPQLAAAACGREATGCEAGGCEGAEEEEGGGGGGDTDIETEDALGDWDDLVGVDDVVVLPEEDLQPHLLAHQVGQAGGNGLLDAAHQHHGGEDAAAAGSGGSAQQQAPPAAAQPGGGLRAPLAKPLPAVLPAPIHVMVGPQTTRKRKRQREKRARATRSGSSSGGGGAVAGGGGAEGQFNSDTDAALARMALPALLATVPAGNVVGLFHPDRYLKGGDCIACGMGMVSRSRFEKIGGSPMAKWYRSIRVVGSDEPLGSWLTRHGLPVHTGMARQRKPRASGPASSSAAAAAAAATQRRRDDSSEDDDAAGAAAAKGRGRGRKRAAVGSHKPLLPKSSSFSVGTVGSGGGGGGTAAAAAAAACSAVSGAVAAAVRA
eukprot:XP_001694753.1 hypothetical protein CHLREDRAFT_196800 [Chlamydomonas reinhardtii]